VLYPENLTRRGYAGLKAADYLIRHQVESGLSIGVFDKEYRYRREESLASEGKLYWDTSDESANCAGLLEQMDFPLVSVALAYDSFDHLDMDKLGELMATLPAFGPSYAVLAKNDKRDAASWEAKGHGEVIFRNATSTRHDYEGKGLMRKLADYMMRDAASKGWRGIQIESMNDAVTHVWTHPPAPFKGEEVSDFHMWTHEEENGKGESVYPFRPAKQRVVKVYCYLRE
jgi:hypothetical protein